MKLVNQDAFNQAEKASASTSGDSMSAAHRDSYGENGRAIWTSTWSVKDILSPIRKTTT
jgi:hypothetical protein